MSEITIAAAPLGVPRLKMRRMDQMIPLARVYADLCMREAQRIETTQESLIRTGVNPEADRNQLLRARAYREIAFLMDRIALAKPDAVERVLR